MEFPPGSGIGICTWIRSKVKRDKYSKLGMHDHPGFQLKMAFIGRRPFKATVNEDI